MVAALLLALLVTTTTSAGAANQADPLPVVIERVQPRIVKLYGAGGFRGMEAYQSGILISPDGYILTVFSHVLDTDYLAAVLHDGRRFDAELLGADPRLEVAVVKIDADRLPHFRLDDAVEAEAGARVLALSNLFGVATGNEPVSVQRGTIAVRAPLDARRGRFETPYRGPVYVLDVTTNNPGAAGGALVTLSGNWLGMLGKELRNAENNTWLNYAVPVEQLRAAVTAIIEGRTVASDEPIEPPGPDRPVTLAALGLTLLPEVLPRTPAYIERIQADSAAAEAQLRPDDLIVMVDNRLVQSVAEVRDLLGTLEADRPVALTILRGGDVPEMLEVVLGGRP